MAFLGKSKVLVRRKGGNSEWLPIINLKPGDVVLGEGRDNEVKEVRTRPLAPKEKIYGFGNDIEFFTDSAAFAGTEGWLSLNPSEADKHLGGWESRRLVPTDVIAMILEDFVVPEITESTPEISVPVVDVVLNGDHTFFVEGCLVHNLGGGGGGGNTTSVTKTDPPAYLEPYLTDLASRAKTASTQVSTAPYAGELIAAPNANELTSLAQAEGLALGATPASLATPYQTASNIAQTSLTNGSLNRYLDTPATITSADTSGVIQAAIDPLRQDLMNNIIPGIKSQAITQGAYGGDRQDFLTSDALLKFDREAQNTAATINYQDLVRKDQLGAEDLWSQREGVPKTSLMEQNLMSLAPQLNSQGFQASFMPSDMLNQVGMQQQLGEQDALDAAFAKWQLEQQAPFAGLPEYASLLNGGPSGGVTNSRTSGGGGGFTSALSGGLGGAMAGMSLLGPAGLGLMSAGAGAGLGGGAGLLLALLSDRRLKEDIKAVGKLVNGLTLYSFRYVGDKIATLGLMADEVELKVPAAVSYFLGHRVVNYQLAMGG